jgi:uncharacterized membrane protein
MLRRIACAITSSLLLAACGTDRVTSSPSVHADVAHAATAASPLFGVGWHFTTLPLPNGYTLGEATAISDDGTAFGWVRQTDVSVPKPVRWSGNAVSFIQLPAGLVGAEIVDVSADGQRIIANAKGQNHAVLGIAHWFPRGLPAYTATTNVLVHGMSRNGRYWTGIHMTWKGSRIVHGEGISGHKIGAYEAIMGTDINDTDVLVGVESQGSEARLLITTPTTFDVYPVAGRGFKVNNAGTIAGTVTIGGFDYAATVVAPYVAPSPKWPGAATAISEKGRIVGNSSNHAMTWLGGAPATLPTSQLARSARAQNVNLCGAIVGSVILGRSRVPAMWTYRGIGGPICD